MKKDPINYAVNIITNTILDGLALDIEALDLTSSDRDKVLSAIEMNRIKKRVPSKGKRPGIKPELQCTRQSKSGNRCGAPRCNTVSCWGHMSDAEKDAHNRKANKSSAHGSKVTRSSTAAARAAEDLADE